MSTRPVRFTDTDYSALVEALTRGSGERGPADAIGGTQTFARGLYGATEVRVDPYMQLYAAGKLDAGYRIREAARPYLQRLERARPQTWRESAYGRRVTLALIDAGAIDA